MVAGAKDVVATPPVGTMGEVEVGVEVATDGEENDNP